MNRKGNRACSAGLGTLDRMPPMLLTGSTSGVVTRFIRDRHRRAAARMSRCRTKFLNKVALSSQHVQQMTTSLRGECWIK